MGVLVIGSFVMDIVSTTNVVPSQGETVLGLYYNTYPGGKGINQAVSAARLGSNVKMAGALGKDAYGQEFFNVMKEEGIDFSNVITTASKTGLGNVIVNKQTAENQIIVIPGANHDYQVSHLANLHDEIKKASVVVLQMEINLDVNYEVARLCKKYNTKLILNPAPAVKLNDEVYPNITYLTPNETELEILTNKKITTKEATIKACYELIDKGVKNVIVTLGSKGSIWVSKDFIKEHPGFKVKAIDTVGAGDTFNGALAYGIDHNLSEDEILNLANRAASISVTRNGAIPSIPTMKEVKEY